MSEIPPKAGTRFEILLDVCTDQLNRARQHWSWFGVGWAKYVSTSLFEKLELFADLEGINSPIRRHTCPFDNEAIVSIWCPWTLECTIVRPWETMPDAPVRRALEDWTKWFRFHALGGEPDAKIVNQSLWPPSGSQWGKCLTVLEPELQTAIVAEDVEALSALFFQSPSTFVRALEWWIQETSNLFADIPPHSLPEQNGIVSPRQGLRTDVSDGARQKVRHGLKLIADAHAVAGKHSPVGLFNGKLFDDVREKGLVLVGDYREMKDASAFVNFRFQAHSLKMEMMQFWLNELRYQHDAPHEGNTPHWDSSDLVLSFRGQNRRYGKQLGDAARKLFSAFEASGWQKPVECRIAPTQAIQCCKDRTEDNGFGIRFQYDARTKTVTAHWD